MPVQTTLNSFWFPGVSTEVTYLSADTKVVSEKRPPWQRGALLNFADRRMHVTTVQSYQCRSQIHFFQTGEKENS